MTPGILWTMPGNESAKQCGRCSTVWKNTWLDNHQAFNECPFCGAIFQKGAKISRPRPKRRKLHWKQVQSIKLLCRLSSDITGIDWALFKNDTYFKVLAKRTDIINLFNKTLNQLVAKLHKT